jgi:hypothetical protein
MVSRPLINLAGQRLRKFTIIGQAPNARWGEIRWHYLCACGNESTSCSRGLRNGTATSCGCGRTGRPPVQAKQLRVRVPVALLARLGAWVKRQPDKPSLPEAMRRLVSKAIDNEARRAR